MKPRKLGVREKTYCPRCQFPEEGYAPRICDHCAHLGIFLPQFRIKLIDNRTITIGGNAVRHPGCP